MSIRVLTRAAVTLAAALVVTLTALPAYAAPTPLVVGHRGATIGAPENTMAAFRFAQAAGVDVIELDVRWTKENTMVVMHDESLDRTTNCYGNVQQRLYVQLRRCDAGSYLGRQWARETIPTLASTLRYARSAGLQVNVEAKIPSGTQLGVTQATAFVGAIAREGMTGRTVVSSFSARGLGTIRKAGDAAGMVSLRYSLISSSTGGLPVTTVRAAGTVYLPSYTSVTANRVAEYRAAGVAVWVWGVRTPEDLTRASKLGADALIVEDPRTALASLRP